MCIIIINVNKNLLKHKTCITIIRNCLFNVYITPPTRFLVYISGILSSSESHSGEYQQTRPIGIYPIFIPKHIHLEKQLSNEFITLTLFVFHKETQVRFQHEAVYCFKGKPLFKLEIPLTMGAIINFRILLQLT